MDCVSCGLRLPSTTQACPACGQHQVLDGANEQQARCVAHPDLAATATCARCGRFMCTACAVADVTPSSCRGCALPLAAELDEKLRRLNVRVGLLAVAQAVLVPALAFASHAPQLAVACLVVAVPGFGFGLLGAVSGTARVGAPIAAGLLTFLCVLGLGAGWLMALGLPLGVLLVRWVVAMGPLEREAWRLRRTP